MTQNLLASNELIDVYDGQGTAYQFTRYQILAIPEGCNLTEELSESSLRYGFFLDLAALAASEVEEAQRAAREEEHKLQRVARDPTSPAYTMLLQQAGGKKPTERSVEAWVKTQDSYRSAREQLQQATLHSQRMNGLCQALAVRCRDLRLLREKELATYGSSAASPVPSSPVPPVRPGV